MSKNRRGKIRTKISLQMKYAVVKFLRETIDGDPVLQEIPVIWLHAKNTMCWWPPNNPGRHIYKSTPPENDWELHPIEVRKIYENIEDARKMCLRDSSSDTELLGKHFRKKKETFKMINRCSSVSPPPRPLQKNLSHVSLPVVEKPQKIYNREDIQELTIPAATNSFNLENQSYDEEQSISGSIVHNYYDLDIQSNQENSESEGTPVNLCSKEYEAVAALGVQQIVSDEPLEVVMENLSNSQPVITSKIGSVAQYSANADILRKITEMSNVLDRVLHIVARCQLGIQDLQEKTRNIPPMQNKASENMIRSFLPLDKIEDLQNFSKTLEESDEMQTEFTSFILLIGGDGPKDHLGRLFAKLFTNKLGVKCSWKGLRDNFKIEDLFVLKVIMDIFKTQYQCSEKKFELYSRDWLRHCKARLESERRINQNKN